MLLCYVLSPSRRHSPRADARLITGRNWTLEIIASSGEGPTYPHLAESEDAGSYRLFAGRLSGVKPCAEFPAIHPVNNAQADDWSVPRGEPDGSWLALKFDRTRDMLSIASDMFVLQHWYYAHMDDVWYFTNSLLFLQRITGRRFPIERRAIPYMMLLGYLPLHYTPVENVFSLMSGQALTVEAGEPRINVRGTISFHSASPEANAAEPSEADWADNSRRILTVLRDAVARDLQYLDAVFVPISGGMDSRFLLGCTMDALPRDRITTYTFGHPRTMDFEFGTAIARDLGLKCIPLAMETRPAGEICADGFAMTEGCTFSIPNCPLESWRNALPLNSHVVSGYVGDAVWGSHDGPQGDAADPRAIDELWRFILDSSFGCPLEDVTSLLRDANWDSLGLKEWVEKQPGETIRIKYNHWLFDVHCGNRITYALQRFRDRAFYLTPYLQRRVWETGYALPMPFRRRERAFFEALKLGYPQLYGYPTTRNHGFPPGMSHRWLGYAREKWWQSLMAVDDLNWRLTGKFYYYGRRMLYHHNRELRQRLHQPDMLQCFEDLKQRDVFNPAALDVLRENYLHRKPIKLHLLSSLLTIQQWMKNYAVVSDGVQVQTRRQAVQR